MSREAMTQALEALESAHPRFGIATERHQQAITALRAALDAPEPTIKFLDPNAWKIGNPDTEPISAEYDQTALELCETCGWKAIVPGDGCLVCAKSWVDITDGELFDLWMKSPAETEDRFAFVRKALAMQKEKNGG